MQPFNGHSDVLIIYSQALRDFKQQTNTISPLSFHMYTPSISLIWFRFVADDRYRHYVRLISLLFRDKYFIGRCGNIFLRNLCLFKDNELYKFEVNKQFLLGDMLSPYILLVSLYTGTCMQFCSSNFEETPNNINKDELSNINKVIRSTNNYGIYNEYPLSESNTIPDFLPYSLTCFSLIFLIFFNHCIVYLDTHKR